MPITGKMSAQHKAKIGESQRARWAKAKAYTYDMDEFDMIIVTTADPLHELPAGAGWKYEGAINKLVGKFINSLPSE